MALGTGRGGDTHQGMRGLLLTIALGCSHGDTLLLPLVGKTPVQGPLGQRSWNFLQGPLVEAQALGEEPVIRVQPDLRLGGPPCGPWGSQPRPSLVLPLPWRGRVGEGSGGTVEGLPCLSDLCLPPPVL